jgi:hypothetical protein
VYVFSVAAFPGPSHLRKCRLLTFLFFGFPLQSLFRCQPICPPRQKGHWGDVIFRYAGHNWRTIVTEREKTFSRAPAPAARNSNSKVCLSAGWLRRLFQICDLERQPLRRSGFRHRPHFGAEFHRLMRVWRVSRPIGEGFPIGVARRGEVHPV